MAEIIGVLFDLDGTLVDSNDAHAAAWSDALQEQSFAVPYANIRSLIGMGADNLLPSLIYLINDSALAKKLSERQGEIFKEQYLPHIKPFPKATELLQKLHDDGKKLVVATSAKPEEANALLDILDARHLFETLTTTKDAKNSKPDPDIVQAALEKSGLSADAVVMVGDTPYDIEAASKSGVQTIALRCGGWDTDKLSNAIAIYNDPADLLANWDKSPLANTQ